MISGNSDWIFRIRVTVFIFQQKDVIWGLGRSLTVDFGIDDFTLFLAHLLKDRVILLSQLGFEIGAICTLSVLK